MSVHAHVCVQSSGGLDSFTLATVEGQRLLGSFHSQLRTHREPQS